jgi:hypothetical protein
MTSGIFPIAVMLCIVILSWLRQALLCKCCNDECRHASCHNAVLFRRLPFDRLSRRRFVGSDKLQFRALDNVIVESGHKFKMQMASSTRDETHKTFRHRNLSFGRSKLDRLTPACVKFRRLVLASKAT